MKLLVVISVLVASAIATQRRYDGYRVYEVMAKDRASFDALLKLHDEGENFDFWTAPRMNLPTDIMVPPAFNEIFINLVETFSMRYRVKIDDVQNLIEKNRNAPQITDCDGCTSRYALNWTSYSDLPVIIAFINELASAHPNLVTVSSAGKSYEGNDMPIVKLSTGGSGKPAIFVDGGIHAREWITPAVVTWIMHELVENYKSHPQYLDAVDWYFMPNINPDGYRYTFSNDRLWRKNRGPTTQARCVGTDMNRNFGFHWNEGGSSANPCSETYHGGSAFSQVESRNVRDAILKIANQTKAYLTIHSYGQYFLTSWGYTSDYPEDYDELYALAVDAAGSLEKLYGTQYTIGTATNVLYVASGGSDDWAKGVANIKYVYTMEVRDEGQYGFELPASQILPTAKETWEAFKVIADKVISL
jgi:hypothetical protein